LEILQVGDIRNQQNDIEEELSVRERTKQRGKDVTLERNTVRNNTFQHDHLEAKQLERIPMATHDREQSGLLRRDAMLSKQIEMMKLLFGGEPTAVPIKHQEPGIACRMPFIVTGNNDLWLTTPQTVDLEALKNRMITFEVQEWTALTGWLIDC